KGEEAMTFAAERIAQFEELVQRLMEEYQAPGLAVILAEGDQVTYFKGFGTRDQEKNLPVTDRTVFGLASVTKSFTALAIMQLAEAGLLSPQDPVVKYLPEFSIPRFDPASVTIEHLITHTAGIPPLPTLGYAIRGNTIRDVAPKEGEKEASFPAIDSIDQLLNYIANGGYRMLGPAGACLSYSNDNYGLLGEIIRRVSGQPYEEYVRDHILTPLGMGRSTFALDEIRTWDDVTELYYKTEDEEFRHSSNWQVAPPFVACGWLKSCATDLIKYVQMHASRGEFGGRRLLSAKGMETMHTGLYRYSLKSKYGYGFRIQDYEGMTLVEHSGSLKGVSSNVGFVPEKGLSAVVLCNLSGFPASKVWMAVINMAMGLPVGQNRVTYEAAEWSQEAITGRVGRYVSGEGATIRIGVDNGQLMAHFQKESFPLCPIAEDTAIYTMKGLDNEVRFFTGEDGRAWAIGAGGRMIPRAEEDEELEKAGG
ncbi:MAG: serine hydrolase domain-containing protein, partial [Bacillota bacterium]